MTSRSPRHVLCAAVLLTLGCAGGTTADGGADADSAPAFSLVEELRIGSADDPNAGFTRIGGVVGREDGSVVVLDSRENQLRLFDAAGKLVRRFGARGDGPGEFRSIMRMGHVGDTVWVFDYSNRRITLFDSSGNLTGILRAPTVRVEGAPGISITVDAVSLRADGTLGSDWSYMAMGGGPNDTLRVPHVRFDTSGALLDTVAVELWTYPAPLTVNGRQLVAPTIPSSFPMLIQWGVEYYHVDRSVATDARQGTLRVTRIGANGDTLLDRAYRYAPRPFTTAMLDTIITRRVDGLMRSGQLPAAALEAAFRQVLHPPAFVPPIVSGRAGDDGVLWLQREDQGGPSRHWLLIAPDGALVGSLNTPRNVNVRWSSGNIVWAVVTDDLEVPWVVRYRLEGAQRR